jgi:catechol 2,3-dioxygenase-like lactoylglutathione lyase family enzyme
MSFYPIITTLVPSECRDFYQHALDARVVFESEWYVHLAIGDRELGFLKPNPPRRLPVFRHARPSSGLTLAFEVPDVSAVYRQFQRWEIETLGKPEESETGEMAFSVMDPAGVILNFVEIKKDPSEIVEI